jgi:hypothetical protein
VWAGIATFFGSLNWKTLLFGGLKAGNKEVEDAWDSASQAAQGIADDNAAEEKARKDALDKAKQERANREKRSLEHATTRSLLRTNSNLARARMRWPGSGTSSAVAALRRAWWRSESGRISFSRIVTDIWQSSQVNRMPRVSTGEEYRKNDKLALTLGAGDARYFINGGINDLSLRDLGNNMEGYWKIHTDGDGLWLTNNQTGGWMLLTSGGTLLLSDHLLDSAENLTNLNASALSLGIIPAGRINTLAGGIGWLTNSTLPNNTTTIRAWLTVTNDSGKVGKLPVYY